MAGHWALGKGVQGVWEAVHPQAAPAGTAPLRAPERPQRGGLHGGRGGCSHLRQNNGCGLRRGWDPAGDA